MFFVFWKIKNHDSKSTAGIYTIKYLLHTKTPHDTRNASPYVVKAKPVIFQPFSSKNRTCGVRLCIFIFVIMNKWLDNLGKISTNTTTFYGVAYEIQALWRDWTEPQHKFYHALLCHLSFVMQTGIGNTQNKWWQTYLSPGMATPSYPAQICPDGCDVEKGTLMCCRKTVW